MDYAILIPPSFTLPLNPSIPNLNHHNSFLPFEFHKGAVPVVLTENYHKVLTTTSTMRGYSYHPERHAVDIILPVTSHRH